jgi:tartronate-semialdehyde synthase
MGTEIDNITEFNDLAETLDDAPTAADLLLVD